MKLPLTVLRLLLTGFLFSIPFVGSAESGREFPSHINKTVEKQKTYHHPFEDVWKTALTVMGEVENVIVKDLKDGGLDSVSSSVKTRKDSGLITLTVTHKGEKSFFTETKSLFLYFGIFMEPVGKHATRLYTHTVNFRSYDGYVFHGKQLARYLDFTPSGVTILDKIQGRFQEKRFESH